MPVLIGRIEQVEVNCLIWHGPVSRSEALGFPGRIDPSRPEFGCRWISYFDPGADLSDLDPACLLELRERLRPVIAALGAKGEFKVLLVSNSKYNDPMLAAWRTMTATDPTYPSSPAFAPDVLSAPEVLGLSAADAERARVWIESQVAHASAAPR